MTQEQSNTEAQKTTEAQTTEAQTTADAETEAFKAAAWKIARISLTLDDEMMNTKQLCEAAFAIYLQTERES